MVRKFALLLCVAVLAALLPAVPARAGTGQEPEDGYSYSKLMDDYAGITYPRWQVCFEPDYGYSFWDALKKLQFWKEDDPEYKSWDIHEMYFDFVFLNRHEGMASVGYDLTLYDINFDFTFLSADGQGNSVESFGSCSYPLREKWDGTGYFTYTFNYDALLGMSSQYSLYSYPTVVKSVRITVSNRLFGTCGTSVIYDFTYKDGNCSASIIETITYSLYNTASSLIPMGYHTSIIDGGDSDFSYMYTLHPGSDEEAEYLWWMQTMSVLKSFPKMLYSFVTNMLQFLLVDIPVYFAMLFPFFPNYIVDGFVYFLYFVFLLSLYRLVKGG